MKNFLRNNGLTIAMLSFFVLSFAGQIGAGHRVFNADQQDHNAADVSLGDYLASGHFAQATFENWESEFLQMAAFVLLTAWLYQKGSSESRDPGARDQPDSKLNRTRKSPWPVHRGGLALKLYEHSLGSVLFILFLLSFALHARGGAIEYNRDHVLHGGSAVSTLGFMKTSTFWFESFQNWQSEFFSIAVLLVITIFLRERGSPQSKKVGDSYSKTGE